MLVSVQNQIISGFAEALQNTPRITNHRCSPHERREQAVSIFFQLSDGKKMMMHEEDTKSPCVLGFFRSRFRGCRALQLGKRSRRYRAACEKSAVFRRVDAGHLDFYRVPYIVRDPTLRLEAS